MLTNYCVIYTLFYCSSHESFSLEIWHEVEQVWTVKHVVIELLLVLVVLVAAAVATTVC